MEAIGARLKKLRLEKGISLEEAHKQTKLHLKVLEALEEDNLVNIKPVYVRGFLKIYCQFLGANPADYLPDFKEHAPRPGRFRLAPAEKVSLRLAPKIKLVVLKNLKPYLKNKQVIFVVIVLGAGVILFTLGRVAGCRKRQAVFLPANYLSPAQKKAERLVVPAKSEETPRQEPSQGIRLAMRAKEDCYIHLKTDGHTVFQRILRKGKSETWNAKEKIEFSLSKANAVSLELNGNPLPPLSTKKRLLKNVVVTRGGQINIQ
jgi:cytoskeletal protein RodZ